MVLILCLTLLPATALAAGEDAPGKLWVGQTQITASGYWKTTTEGNFETGSENDYNVYYDGNGTLTLNGATIQGGTSTGSVPYGAGIYAQCSNGQSVTLTIELIGENTITGNFGIYVNAEMSANSYGTDASLNITGNGSLIVTGTNSHGIFVKSGTGNASLTIYDASVVANTTQTYSGPAGVCVQSSVFATSSPNLSLAVHGGSLAASGTGNSDGILLYVGSTQAAGATTSLTATENAIVRAKNGIKAERVDKPTPSGTGIVFDGGKGTVYGSVTLQENITIGEDESLAIGDGASLNTGSHEVIVNGGTLTGGDKITGTVKYAPAITTESLPNGTVNEEYSQTLAATGSDTITWSLADGSSLPAGLNLDENTGKIYGTPTTAEESTFTVTATNAYGSASKQLSIAIDAQTNVPVTGVSLNETSLTLTEKETSTLTATVEPNNATNQTVTWKSSDTNIATVDTDGNVTAVAEGTATITVTTADGGKTATCEVTVTHVHTMTKTEAKPATCTEAGNTAYWYCSGCQKYFKDEAGTEETTLADTTILATGHTFRGGWCAVCGARDPNYVPPANPNYRIDVTTTEHGTVTADPAAAKAEETVTLTPAPEEGYEVGDVTVTDRFGDAVEVTENPDGTYTFTMPSGQVKVEVTFVEAVPEPLPFTDVSETDWFHDAVQYAYENGLMDGVGDGQFAPNATTNRAMVVTILYRLAGEPAVSGQSDFTDVADGLWYTDAVAWAAEKGIVNGISATEFAPSGDLTREQLATVLYRYAEGMGYDVSAQADLSGFPDADQIQSYATQALSWAVAEGLLQGFEDDSLQPGGTATRAQIATILMRFLAAAPTA